MVQRIGHLNQLCQVDTLSLEHFLNIRLLTINLFCKPIDSATLSKQLFMDHIANVDIFHYKLHSRAF